MPPSFFRPASALLTALFLALPLTGVPFLRAEEKPDAAQIFAQVEKTYQEAKSFSCQIDFDRNEKGNWQHTRESGLLRFVRPGLLRLDWGAPSQQWASSIFTRDKNLYVYWNFAGRYSRQPSPEAALNACGGISGGVSLTVPPLLLGKKGRFENVTFQHEADRTVDGANCFILAGIKHPSPFDLPGSFEIAVDKKSHALLLIKEESLIPAASGQPARVVHRIESYSRIAFDRPIAPGDFVYSPPPYAKEVDDLFKTASRDTPKP